MSQTEKAPQSRSGGRPGAAGAPGPMALSKKLALVLICVALIGSVGARAFLSGRGGAEGTPNAQTQGFLPGDTPGVGEESAEPTEEAKAESALPYITEGSFFALIGFALGYASRKVMKVGLIFLAIFFVGIQSLAFADVIDVDWPRAVQLVNKLVLNLQEGQTFTDVIKDRVPTVGALVTGYFLGFRKG